MELNYLPIREELCRAGIRLSEEGLVARTWGNLSIRVSDEHFLISPSGVFYKDTTPEHLGIIAISNGDSVGEYKPSGEKDLHRLLYNLDSNIGAIIHTHQSAASAVAAARVPIGDNIPIAKYALPTTLPLAKHVAYSYPDAKVFMENSTAKVILLANHGVVITALNMDEAIDAAIYLEEVATDWVKHQFETEEKGHYLYSGLNRVEGEEDKIYRRSDRTLPKLIEDIFHYRADINYILHSWKPYSTLFSHSNITLRPLLDDLAQLVGTKVVIARYDINHPLKKSDLGSRNALFLDGEGVLCCATTEDDVLAVQMVVEKSARSYIDAEVLGGGMEISRIESLLMRLIYKKKYSKMSNS